MANSFILVMGPDALAASDLCVLVSTVHWKKLSNETRTKTTKANELKVKPRMHKIQFNWQRETSDQKSESDMKVNHIQQQLNKINYTERN